MGYYHRLNETTESKQDKNQGEKQQKDERSEGGSADAETSPEKLQTAVETFQSALNQKSHDLKAVLEGQGPGLKIILRDGTGALIRQFTGEEFLKVKHSVAQSGHCSGKILDKKH